MAINSISQIHFTESSPKTKGKAQMRGNRKNSLPKIQLQIN